MLALHTLFNIYQLVVLGWQKLRTAYYFYTHPQIKNDVVSQETISLEKRDKSYGNRRSRLSPKNQKNPPKESEVTALRGMIIFLIILYLLARSLG